MLASFEYIQYSYYHVITYIITVRFINVITLVITMEAKIRKLGNSLGIILPKQILDVLDLKEGDKIDLNTKEGEITLKLTRK